MADPKKATELDVMLVFNAGDLILMVDDPSGTPINKVTTLKALFAAIPANTVINARFTVNANSVHAGANAYFTANTLFRSKVTARELWVANNHLRINQSSTPANSSVTVKQGTLKWDSSYIYLATANNTTKRVALSSF